MADEPLPRVLTSRGAARLGLTDAAVRTELRRGRWRRLASGVLLTRPDDPTRDDWIHVGVALGGRAATLSGWDAVRLRGIASAMPPSAQALVLVPSGKNRVVGGVHLRPSAREVPSTQLSALDERLPSVRIASVARAISDAAMLYGSFAPVRAMVTSAVQRRFCTPAELAAELAASPRNGSRWLRLALSDVIGGARSIAEAEAIALLRSVAVPPFEANAPIYDERGRLIYVVDLLWPTLRAIVEIDSREFHFGELAWKKTLERHNRLTALGYAVTHYPPSDIRARGRGWALEVARWLGARARSFSA